MEYKWIGMDNKCACNDLGMPFKDNTYPWKCTNMCKPMPCNMNKQMDMGMGKEIIPVQSMGSPIYGIIYQVTLINLNKHMYGQMPKSISKDEFNVIVNDSMCELTKKEKEFKEILKSRCTENDEIRLFCPYCNGMLKSVVEVALITSLMNGGCMFCH